MGLKGIGLHRGQKLQVLLGLFVMGVVSANLMGTKIADFGLFTASVAILMYPVTFLVTDAVEEVFGKEKVKGIILAGFVSTLAVMALTVVSVWLAPAGRYADNGAFLAVFQPSIRIMLASMVAFLVAQYHDMQAFAFWKKRTGGRFLWARNNLSTVASQFIDTALFMFIAFYMAAPGYTAEFIFALIIPYWLVKVLFALCDTPFVYAIVWWLRRGGE